MGAPAGGGEIYGLALLSCVFNIRFLGGGGGGGGGPRKLATLRVRAPIDNVDRLDLRRKAKIARAPLSRNHHGKLRSGKMAELRIECGILWIPVAAFCFSSPVANLRRFRAFRISALVVGRQWTPPRNASRGSSGRNAAVK